jgi:hypothetical protein
MRSIFLKNWAHTLSFNLLLEAVFVALVMLPFLAYYRKSPNWTTCAKGYLLYSLIISLTGVSGAVFTVKAVAVTLSQGFWFALPLPMACLVYMILKTQGEK